MSLSGMVESPCQPDVIKKILQHLGLWEDSHAPPRNRSTGERDYLRSILRFDKLTVPRKIEGQPADITPLTPIGSRCLALCGAHRSMYPASLDERSN